MGEDGHRALAEATASPDGTGEIDLAGVEVRPGALDGLRRLAVGHWLRRWWPASVRDGIAGLNPAVLDAEIALATAGADEFFGDDTLDSDVAGLLAPHAEELRLQLLMGDPRIADLVRRCVDLADECGVDAPGWPELAETLADAVAGTPVAGRRDDYALAAGRGGGPEPAEVIARGVARWRGQACPAVCSMPRTAPSTGPSRWRKPDRWYSSAPPSSAPDRRREFRSHCTATVFMQSGRWTRTAALRLALFGEDGRPATAHEAWDADWSGTALTVGVDVEEDPEVRRAGPAVRAAPARRTTAGCLPRRDPGRRTPDATGDEPTSPAATAGPAWRWRRRAGGAAIPASASNTTRCAALTVSSAWS